MVENQATFHRRFRFRYSLNDGNSFGVIGSLELELGGSFREKAAIESCRSDHHIHRERER